MIYDALTIDTNIVYQNGKSLTSGIVAEIEQCREGLTQFVLSEIVLRELNRMLSEKAKQALDGLEKGLRLGTENAQLDSEGQGAIKEILANLKSAEDHSKEQLKAFAIATDVEIIRANEAGLDDVIASYFRRQPPFAKAGKKDEFPDAIALLSLEKWANNNNKRVLAVSTDSDWSSFAETRECIDVIDSLSDALALLIENSEEAKQIVIELMNTVTTGENESFRDEFEAGLGHAVEDYSPYIDFSSHMPGECESSIISLSTYELPEFDGAEADVSIVRIKANGFVARIPIFIRANTEIEISFAIYDSIDKDYVPMGSAAYEPEIEIDAAILVDFVNTENTEDDDGKSSKYAVSRVQLIDAPDTVDVGDIEYSLAEEDYDDFDWEEEDAEDEETQT